MSTPGTLYFWANGLSFDPNLDHTWVTSYPFVNGQYPSIGDIPAGSSYWYCWGIYHPSGDGGVDHHPNGAIGQAAADLEVARKIVEANTPPPTPPIGSASDPQDGSITFYAVDGVCHNVANQVLFATGSATVEPVRVSQARGYPLSSFFYTNYGLNEAAWKALREAYAPDVKLPGDDFGAWFLATLPNVSAKQALEVALARAAAQVALQKIHQEVPNMTADEVWAAVAVTNLTALVAVEKALGATDFLALFPSFAAVPTSAQEAAAWIDRDMLDASVELQQVRSAAA